MEEIGTASLLWDIRYRESGTEKFLIKEDFFHGWLKELVIDKEVTSVTFYGIAFIRGRELREKQIYEEALTKTEFMNVTDAWIDDRKKRIGIRPNCFSYT
jgi:hypothetical protein